MPTRFGDAIPEFMAGGFSVPSKPKQLESDPN
jgi:hypothetical protein